MDIKSKAKIPSWKQCHNKAKEVEKVQGILLKLKKKADSRVKALSEWLEIIEAETIHDGDALTWILAHEAKFDVWFYRVAVEQYNNCLTDWREMVELRTAYVTGQIDGTFAVDEQEDDNDDDWDDEDF